ncbi:HAD family hydrolase [Congregibacter brevis]|uniref:HAD family hydrolase n=1 Tax=Congregibacter brevis TaxID=3081201 RepID=A0ABZ0IDC2_9GAMM|nr:HAD family hydrolase [Congregibacter sp. IMCC45268]
MTLAIFDLDNTLIAGDSDHLWGEYLCTQNMVDETQFRAANEGFYADYQRGELDIQAYLAFALAPLAGRSPESLRELQTSFLKDCIEPILLSAAAGLIQEHRSRGDRLLIITATNEFVTAPIARLLGIEELLGCAVEVANGVLTGRPTGTLTYREGKVARLKEWLIEEGESLEGAWFYSDSHNDLPLLEVVDNPVAVDADPTLSHIAQDRGWPQISLRA